MKIHGQIGSPVTVVGGAIVLPIVTQYGTLNVPVRGFRISVLNDETTDKIEAVFDIDIDLPDWIEK